MGVRVLCRMENRTNTINTFLLETQPKNPELLINNVSKLWLKLKKAATIRERNGARD